MFRTAQPWVTTRGIVNMSAIACVQAASLAVER